MIKYVQRAWFYFRMGNGLYLAFPTSYISFVLIVYNFAIAKVAWLSFFHFWAFFLIFGPAYFLIGGLIGRLHMHTQNWAESEAAAPQSPYEYKMKPFGKDKLLSTPSSLTSIQIQKATLLLIERLAPDIARDMDVKRLLRELNLWEGMTETLLSGGEIR